MKSDWAKSHDMLLQATILSGQTLVYQLKWYRKMSVALKAGFF